MIHTDILPFPPSSPWPFRHHWARPYTEQLFRDYEWGNRRAAAATYIDKPGEGQPSAIPIPNLTGTFRVSSPSSSEDSELSEATSRACLKATTSDVELSRAGFGSSPAGLQTTVADFEQETGKVSAITVEVPQTERGRDLLVETQEDAQPFNGCTHNKAGRNFEQMGPEPEAETTVVDDLRFRSADEYLANASPIVCAHFNSIWTEADRQVVAEDFARAMETNHGALISIPIWSRPTSKIEEQYIMDISPDIVATEAVFHSVPVNAADE